MKTVVTCCLVVLIPMLTGCTGPSALELENQWLERHYYIVLHPLDLEWDAETGTLDGRFYVSYIEPNYPASFNEAILRGMSVLIMYFDHDGTKSFSDRLAQWGFGYDSELAVKEGETYAFNFTTRLPPGKSTADIGHITFNVGYRYSSEVTLDDGTRDLLHVDVIYRNGCMRADGGHLWQFTDDDECSPENWASNYRLRAAGAALAPVDYWSKWTWIDDYPSLLRVRDFLNSYEYDDVKYYSGTVRCSICEDGTWSS